MTWVEDFIDQTGLDPDQLIDVILDLPQNAELKARRDRERAAERARELLFRHLDDTQRAQFLEAHRFVVVGSNGGRYCVHLGRQQNVWRLDAANRHTTNLCVHVAERVPDEDNVLAQTLLLENNEDEFLRIANRR